MQNKVFIDEKPRIKPPSFAGCFFVKKGLEDDVLMGVALGAQYALVSLQRGTFYTALTPSQERAFGEAGRESFDQITSTISIIPEL